MHLPYLAFLLSLTFSCTITPNPTIPVSDSDFSHSEFDTFLHQHVDESGLIDYPVLLKERPNLDRYIARTAHVSPDSHPALFARESDRLVYWINAYNAATINQILAYYPIANVGDVKPPWYGFFFPQRSGFFLFTRSLYGGRALNLYYLENSII